MKRFLSGVVAVTLFFAVPALAQDAPPPPGATPREIEEGQKASDEFESAKTTKLLHAEDSPAAKQLLDKLNGMAKKLGAVSARPQIDYVVKVVENKDVNAFTLPNGHIYVFRGLIDAVSSDDELAGVLAHEIGHNARMHALRGEKHSKKLGMVGLAAMLAVVMGGQGGANIAQFSQYLLVGVMNGYGVGYEKEADSAGLEEMRKAGYNPSAMVTFMRQLELIEQRSPEVKLGIFQTHPPSDERADAMLAQLQQDGLTFTPRAVTGAKTVVVSEKTDRYSLKLGDVTLIELAKTPDAPKNADGAKRAQSIADKINELLRTDLQMYELNVSGNSLSARGAVLVTASPADLKIGASARQWSDNFKRLFWKERLNGRF